MQVEYWAARFARGECCLGRTRRPSKQFSGVHLITRYEENQILRAIEDLSRDEL